MKPAKIERRPIRFVDGDVVSAGHLRRCHFLLLRARSLSKGQAGEDDYDTAQPVGEAVVQACTKDPHAPFMSKVRSMIKTKQISLFQHS